METITILSDGNKEGQPVWMAKYSDKETIKVMGTDTLPTPFFTVMPKAEVIEIIQGLNPEFKVY